MKNRSIKIFLLRHCEDVASQMGKFEDLKLTINGNAQAEKIANYFASIPVTKIISSPMIRAKETANTISQTTGVSVRVSELLKDRDVGKAHGMTYKQVQKQFAHIFNQPTFAPNFRFPDGETNNDVFLRATQFVNSEIKVKGGTNEILVIVSHSLTLNYMIYILQNLGFQNELLYLFEYGMGCVINKEYGKEFFHMIEFRSFYDINDRLPINNNL